MKYVKKIGTVTSTFAIRVTGTKCWIWDRGLSLREVRNARIEEWPDTSAGDLRDCYLLDDLLVELCIGEPNDEGGEELVVFENGRVKMRGVERCVCKDGLASGYSREVPVVREIKSSSSYDYTEDRNDPKCFDPTKLELLISSMVIDGVRKRVLIGCAYRGKPLAYAGGDDNGPVSIVSTAVVYRAKTFSVDSRNAVPQEVRKSDFFVHAKELVEIGVKAGVHYYGGFALSGRGMLGVFECIPDDVLCNRKGDYICDQLFMKDSPRQKDPFKVRRIDGYEETAYVYNAVSDYVGRRCCH